MKVRVRIAVAVDPTGHWSANGWSHNGENNDEEALDSCQSEVGNGAVMYFVESDLDIPDRPKVVSGATILPT